MAIARKKRKTASRRKARKSVGKRSATARRKSRRRTSSKRPTARRVHKPTRRKAKKTARRAVKKTVRRKAKKTARKKKARSAARRRSARKTAARRPRKKATARRKTAARRKPAALRRKAGARRKPAKRRKTTARRRPASRRKAPARRKAASRKAPARKRPSAAKKRAGPRMPKAPAAAAGRRSGFSSLRRLAARLTPPVKPPVEAYSGAKPYLFASYSHRNMREVFTVLKKLAESRFRIWYDEGIEPGNEWPEEVGRALTGCRLFLVFMSPQAMESRNVRNEINLASSENKSIMVVNLQPVELSEGMKLQIGTVQFINKHELGEEEFMQKLKDALSPELRV